MGNSIKLKVVRLAASDAARFAALRARALADSPWAFGEDPADESVVDSQRIANRLTDPSEAVFAIESPDDEGRSLVAAAGVIRAEEPQYAHRARIWGVFVDPAFRGRGFGSAVLKAAIKHAQAWRGVDFIDLGVSENSPEALKLYRSLGFEQWGREPETTDYQGRRYDEIFMTLRLRSPRRVAELRHTIEMRGIDDLVVDDLTAHDLNNADWLGSRTHLKYVQKALDRVPSGEVEYLAVRGPNGEPIAKGGIDYAKRDGGAELWQLATHPSLQGLGLGTKLIAAAEDRMRARGLQYSYLGVEGSNPEARRLYERLGYTMVGRETDSWEQEDEQGSVYTHETEVAVMRKELPSA